MKIISKDNYIKKMITNRDIGKRELKSLFAILYQDEKLKSNVTKKEIVTKIIDKYIAYSDIIFKIINVNILSLLKQVYKKGQITIPSSDENIDKSLLLYYYFLVDLDFKKGEIILNKLDFLDDSIGTALNKLTIEQINKRQETLNLIKGILYAYGMISVQDLKFILKKYVKDVSDELIEDYINLDDDLLRDFEYQLIDFENISDVKFIKHNLITQEYIDINDQILNFPKKVFLKKEYLLIAKYKFYSENYKVFEDIKLLIGEDYFNDFCDVILEEVNVNYDKNQILAYLFEFLRYNEHLSGSGFFNLIQRLIESLEYTNLWPFGGYSFFEISKTIDFSDFDRSSNKKSKLKKEDFKLIKNNNGNNGEKNE